MINTRGEFLDMVHVELWHESQAEFGIASHKTGDFHWNRKTIEGLKNGDIFKRYKRKEVSQVVVVETLQGDLVIIQIAGYSYNRGCYCDVI